jgi:hypothetical protein
VNLAAGVTVNSAAAAAVQPVYSQVLELNRTEKISIQVLLFLALKVRQ